MKKMTKNEMINANGGQKKFMCKRCGKTYSLYFPALLHAIVAHNSDQSILMGI